MNLLKLPLICLLILATVATPIAGQQKRRTTDKSPAKSPAAPAPAPVNPVTFDTLLAADSYKIYGEVRGLGQLIRSNAATEVLEPVLRLGGPTKEFRSLVNWLIGHADQVMTSRLLVAAWPTAKEVPEVVIAIEFSSAEEAAKFESQLNRILSSVLPPVAPQISSESSPEKTPQGGKEKKKLPQVNEPPAFVPSPTPAYHLQRADSLLLFTPKPVQLKKLRPKDSKLLAEDPNFRVAYNRFSSEPVFMYIDVDAIMRDQEELRKQVEEDYKKTQEAQKELAEKQKAEAVPQPEEPGEGEPGEEEQGEAMPDPPPPEVPTELVVVAQPPSESQLLANALGALRFSLFGTPDLPNGVGFGFSPDNESYELRALLVDSPGESSDPFPILFAGIRFGAPISPESPRVLPGSSELVVTLAIDFAEMYELMSLMETPAMFSEPTEGGQGIHATPEEMAAPLSTIERLLKIKIKDEVLPVLGSEIAISLPASDFNPLGPPRLSPQPEPKKDSETASPAPRAPFVVIAVRDREAARQLMPKLLAGFGGKAATSLAQTERRDDTELVSIANLFAYAFVGNFLVLAPDAATTRYVVDSYLKGETLSADSHFRNSTRWQPRQVQGQIYISPALTESYRTWANSPNTHLPEEARNLIARLSATAQPITYSLSNDGLGALHELRIPRNLVALAIAGAASSENPPETATNERTTMTTLWTIASAERRYKENNGSGYGSLEQLIEAGLLTKETVQASTYKFDLRLTAGGFEVTAVPAEYGKTGKLSFFLDQSGVIRGADRGGAAASASDPLINY